MASLIIQTGKHHGRRVSMPPDGRLIIGRDPECHIRLASTEVSRQHCIVEQVENGLQVQDLNSRNGTFIDGYLVSGTSPLRPGSVLRVGPMEFLLPGRKARKTDDKDSALDDTSDNDIAAWLTEEGETNEVNLEDSTIIPKNRLPPDSKPVEETDPLDAHPHAREAAEIIQRHWQSKQQF